MIETTMASIPLPTHYGEWEQTANLRLAVPPHTTTASPVLQQEWRRPGISKDGYLCGWDTEWRNVPVVVVA